MKIIQKSKKGLEKIIKATRDIYKNNSLELFASAVSIQIESILKLNLDSFLVSLDGLSFKKNEDNLTLLSSKGKFENKQLNHFNIIY